MDDPLTVPETLEILARRGVGAGFSVWSRRYEMPPSQLDDGWELVENSRYGWQLRWRRRARIASTIAYATESEGCAALLRELLTTDSSATPRTVDRDAYRRILGLWRHAPWRRRPRSRPDLAAALVELGVPASAYTLHGGGFEGRLCLEERRDRWTVHRVRDGGREGVEVHAGEEAACEAFWRRLVDDDLPTLLGVRPGGPPPRSEVPADDRDDDLTISEVLAIWEREGVRRRFGIQQAGEEHVHLRQRSKRQWELCYTERGRTKVMSTFDREGDACAAICGSGVSAGAAFASGTDAKLAATHADSSYERLLHHWRQHPWRDEPTTRDELAYLLRDRGFPIDSYNLAGGRFADVLTIERRLDHWQVYGVRKARRVRQTVHATEAGACAAFWCRAVDEVIPTLVS